MTDPSLSGRRVMIVEDEFLVAMLLEGILEDEGVIIVGPSNEKLSGSRVMCASTAASNRSCMATSVQFSRDSKL